MFARRELLMPAPAPPDEIRAGQSLELLKALHILTRDGALNQDSRRKLKQVYHLYNFIEPLLLEAQQAHADLHLVDHGAGKSYLGFILYDLFFRLRGGSSSGVWSIETRAELVERARELADRLGFAGMHFVNLSVADAIAARELPARVDLVTALHACDTATDDAISFALARQAKFLALVPCCQAELAATLRKHKATALAAALGEVWRHPLHTREFGSHLTNVLRCLRLQAHGYEVRVTELTGWEHALKNELIIAVHKNLPTRQPARRLAELLTLFGLDELRERFA